MGQKHREALAREFIGPDPEMIDKRERIKILVESFSKFARKTFDKLETFFGIFLRLGKQQIVEAIGVALSLESHQFSHWVSLISTRGFEQKLRIERFRRKKSG